MDKNKKKTLIVVDMQNDFLRGTRHKGGSSHRGKCESKDKRVC